MIRFAASLYGLYLLLPIVLLLVGAFGQRWTNTFLPTGFTLGWFGDLWADGSFRRAFSTSLVVALGACVANTLVGVPLAYALHHGARRRIAIAARLIAALPIAVPTITLGFGYMLVFNTDLMPWLGSLPLLIAAHAVHTLPYLTQTLVADLRHLQLERLEDAAATLGATPTQRFVGIVLPNLRHSLLAGLVMVASISIGEFGLSNLLTSFHTRTYPVVLLQAFYGATGFACAATVVLLLLASVATITSTQVGRPR
jgi:putative spermidine/putrescine transport system permease protein